MFFNKWRSAIWIICSFSSYAFWAFWKSLKNVHVKGCCTIQTAQRLVKICLFPSYHLLRSSDTPDGMQLLLGACCIAVVLKSTVIRNLFHFKHFDWDSAPTNYNTHAVIGRKCRLIESFSRKLVSVEGVNTTFFGRTLTFESMEDMKGLLISSSLSSLRRRDLTTCPVELWFLHFAKYSIFSELTKCFLRGRLHS